ncbi:AMP-dependent synthetase/ligase domain - like 4 [Theobroma cacao]|nr:AMP-dependent synthetase/ligase domain - like 4 [Theobroma cacao]
MEEMKVFSAKVADGREGQDGKPSVGPIYRNLLAKNGYPPPDPDMSTTWSLFSSSVQKHRGNRMLGWRKMVDGKAGAYIWKTYGEVYDEVLHIGSALRASGAEPGCRVGIYGANCPQWILAMEVCFQTFYMKCLPEVLRPRAVNFIIDHAEVDFVFVQDIKVKELLDPNCKSAQRLKAIVCFTSLTEEDNAKASQLGIKTFSWIEFLCMGKENPQETSPPQPFNICTIMYTSGTSGDPKGVVLTHETIATFVYGVDLFLDQFEDKNLKELRDDIMELKPTFLAGVPRVFDMIHEGKPLENFYMLIDLNKLSWMNRGYKHKQASPLADLLAFRKVKAKLGGRLRLLISGGAPLSSEVEEFLRVTCCAFVVQGYGLTETCGACAIGYPDEMCMVGTVGSPAVYNELRLEEVSEMGYNPLGNPPCGEICVRGKTIFSEYYKNPELTRESIKDGWFHTGDIGQVLPNGVVKIIDRKKNLIKLSQGEYVALEYLENVYGTTPIVDDVWVYGNSFKSMLVAVVVLHEDNAKKWANLNGHTGSLSELCSVNQLQSYVLSELKSTAEKNKMRGFEFIKGVILEPYPFDMERDLVTATLKKKRNNLLKYYQAEIDALYQKLTAKK